MPLDHYVPQVYLRNWLSPDFDHKLLYAIRKNDLKKFTPSTKDVCVVKNGNSNSFLTDERAIETFLCEIEPKFRKAVAKIKSKKIDKQCIRTIAGIVASISICSPTMLRLHQPMLKQILMSTAVLREQRDFLPTLDSGSLLELVNRGLLELKVDGKYPQSFGIKAIEDITRTLGNGSWEVIENRYSKSPFFTSDYPIVLEESSDDSRFMNKIFPIDPFCAILIKPDINSNLEDLSGDFGEFTCRYTAPNRTRIEGINRLIVRAAEGHIFYKFRQPWIEKFVERNRGYRIEGVARKYSTSDGFLLIERQQIEMVEPVKFINDNIESGNWFEFVIRPK